MLESVNSFIRAHKRLTIAFGVLIVLYFIYASYFSAGPLINTLSLNGRQALVLNVYGLTKYCNSFRNNNFSQDGSDTLSLVTFKAFNRRETTLIPNTPIGDFYDCSSDSGRPIYRPVAILDSGTVVWTDTRDNKNYKIMKYENGKTTEVISIPLFDLPSFADAYEKGQVQITEKTLNSTGDIYRMPFILFDDHTIGWLDAMASKGNGEHLTEAEIRLRKVDVAGKKIIQPVVLHKGYGPYDISKISTVTNPWFLFSVLDYWNGSENLRFSGNISVSRNDRPLDSYIYMADFLSKDTGIAFRDSDALIFRGDIFRPDGQDPHKSETGILICNLLSSEVEKCHISPISHHGPFLDPEGKRQLNTNQ